MAKTLKQFIEDKQKIIKETLNEISSTVFFASDTSVVGAIMSKSVLLIFENIDYSYPNIDLWDEESKKYHDELVRKFKNNDNIDLSKEEQKVSIYDLMKKETMDKLISLLEVPTKNIDITKKSFIECDKTIKYFELTIFNRNHDRVNVRIRINSEEEEMFGDQFIQIHNLYEKLK